MSEEVTDIIDQDNSEEITLGKGGIIDTNIGDEMKAAYLDYAMSVIVSRALPDVRDGLKPVQRRIIYAMQDQNMGYNGKYHKSAAVVGEVLKKYHPHGDTSVYDAMVRMAQDFSLRYPLVDGQGNFGSIDGDSPAAMRYTEAKLMKISDELYRDIDKETVDYFMNDLQNEEPGVLPSLLPTILLNGVTGIAVGMATNIPPHNLTEVINGIEVLIEKGDYESKELKDMEVDLSYGKHTLKVAETNFSSEANVEDLMEHIKGPDFPTGGTIYDKKEMMQLYATGKGKIVTRAKMEIEEQKKGKTQIVVTEIPYMVNKATLVTKIAHLVKSKKITGIADLRDETNRKGLRIVIELKKDAIPMKVQNRLYKYSELQNNFNGNMVALVHGEPKLLTLKTILEEFVKHRQEIVVRRTIYLFKKAKAREHILQGLKIALDNLDEVIKLIRSSKDADTAKTGLMEKFGLTEIQAQAILDMQLRKLAALERQKIEDELKEIIETIKDFENLLISPQRIIDIVKDELVNIRETYGDERKTKVVKGKVGELSDEDLIVNEKCIVTISRSGYVKRMKEDTYKTQGRGGKGVKGQTLKEEDIIDAISSCNTHDYAFFFTNKGKVYKLRIWDIPEASRTAKGTAIVNFLGIGQEERIQAFLTMTAETLEAGEGFIFFGTEKGKVKKTALKDFENIRTSGIMAINLSDDDNLVWVRQTTGKDEIMLITYKGQSIRFNEKDVRPMGRTASGVGGIKLKGDDYVIGMEKIDKETENGTMITVSENGYGKRTSVTEYKQQNRGGSGIKTYNVATKTGAVVSSRLLPEQHEDTDLLIATTNGNIIRLEIKQVPVQGRSTIGVRLIKLSKDDQVTSVAFLMDEEDEE